jgi:glycosyltransferase involved in cell wall biosynthesis
MRRAARWLPKGDFVRIGRLGGYYDLRDFSRCQHLVGITPDIVAHCRRGGWSAETTHMIPNFVEDVQAAPHPRASLDTPEDAPLIFALGRLHRNKAFDILLTAVSKVPGAWLWLAGEGPLRGQLEAQAAALGITERVRFLGWQTDSAPYFAAADVYVVPSRHEPLGSVVLEGWMSRVPMVAAASQGPKWLIEPEKDALMVPIDDAEAMADALKRLIADEALAERLVEAGREKYEREFTEAVAVQRYLDLFERVTA